MDRQEIFADDVQVGVRQQVMDVGDAAGDRVLDRDHAEIGLAGGDRRQRVLEGRAGQRLASRIDLARGDMGIGAGLALERDFQLGHVGHPWRLVSAAQLWPSMLRARFSRSSGVSTPSGTVSTMRDVDAHAGFERAQLLELLALLQRRRRQRDEALERRAAIGVEADMMVERPVARARWRG